MLLNCCYCPYIRTILKYVHHFANIANLKFDETYEFKNIIELFNSEVSLKLINLAWYSSNQEDNIIRYKLTKKGIENFLSKY